MIGLVFPLILTLLAILFKGNSLGGFLLAGMSAIGGLIATWFFLSIGSDGSLTELTGGVQTVIASAATTNVWTYLTLLPLALAAMAFMAAIYRGYEST